LDLVIGFSNASFNLGAACGAQSWLLTTLGVWTRCGAENYPWYSQVRTFTPPEYGEWTRLMEDVAQALTVFAGKRVSPRAGNSA